MIMLFLSFIFLLMILRPPGSTRTDTLFPYTTLFRSHFSGCVRLASYRKSNQKLLMLSQGQSFIFAYQRSIRMGPTSTPKKRAAPGYPGRPDRNRTLREPSGSFNVRSFLSFEFMLPTDSRGRQGKSEARRVGKECVSM